jgi:thiamine-phosphate diphosphorylase
VTLPRLLVFTDRTQCRGPLVETVAEAIHCGARAVVLREKDLPEEDRAGIATALRGLLRPVAGNLIMAGAGADAVHLAARDAFPASRPALLGRSCHDAIELAAACTECCDYVTLSPVFATGSKPGYGPALRPDGLRVLLGGASGPRPPAYALGGVRPADVAACLRAGAHGVAVMGTVMRTPRSVTDYLAALQEAAR